MFSHTSIRVKTFGIDPSSAPQQHLLSLHLLLVWVLTLVFCWKVFPLIFTSSKSSEPSNTVLSSPSVSRSSHPSNRKDCLPSTSPHSCNSQAKTVCFFKQETDFPAAAGSLCQGQGGWQTPFLHPPGVEPCPPLQSRYQPSSPGQQLHNLPLQLPVQQPGAGLLSLRYGRNIYI